LVENAYCSTCNCSSGDATTSPDICRCLKSAITRQRASCKCSKVRQYRPCSSSNFSTSPAISQMFEEVLYWRLLGRQ
jgi:hypothetical protein